MILRRNLFSLPMQQLVLLIGMLSFSEVTLARFQQKVFLHLVCDGGMDPSMVFEWKGTAVNSFAQEDGASKRLSASGLEHVSHTARPSVDLYFDRWGDRTAIINGITAADMTPKALGGAALHVGAGGKGRIWLSAYAEDNGKGRPAPVLLFPDFPLLGQASDMNLLASIPSDLLSPVIARRRRISGVVREALFSGFRTDLVEFSADFRSGSGDQQRSLHLDRQMRFQRELESEIPAIWGRVHNPAMPDFVSQAKVSLEYFSMNKSLGALVRVGGKNSWATPDNHFQRQTVKFEELFAGLNSILDHAYALGIQSRLVIIVSGQQGKSPWLNQASGKDPWPVSSVMIWGDGIRSGATGRSDSTGRPVKINPRFGTTTGSLVALTMENIYASLLYLGRVDYRRWTSSVPISPMLEGK